jgi:YQGE family putative transporter
MERITVVLQRLAHRGRHHTQGFVQLFISKRLIHGLASAMGMLFVPIFIYEVSGGQFWFVGLFYAVASLAYVIFLVPGMYATNRIGFSKALSLGVFFAVLNYATLYFITTSNYIYLVPLLIVTSTLFRMFHWVPFHVDFTEFTKGGSRGRDVSLTMATVAFMGMLGPVLAGFLIEEAGFSMMFLVSIILMVIAAFSYLFVPAVHEKFTWSYRKTLEHFFSEKFRPILIGEMAYGAETIVTLLAWPIFLYTILNGNMLEIGGVSTLIVGATILIQLVVGKKIDAKTGNSIKLLRRGSVMYAIGWIIKIFVISATQVFFVGLYHSITKIFTKTPYTSLLYDMSGEQGHYIDEFTVIKEMANHSGRVLSALAMVLLTFYFSVEWMFIIGAAAALLFNMLYHTARTSK